MGGIKNNLTKKLSKFLPLDMEGGRRSLPDGVINNKVPLWLKGNVRRQSDKGIVLTRYLGIACLTLAILSTLILNIVSSYSLSKVNSKAEPVSNSNANVSALADNEASTNALDPTSISISISSHSATGDANDGNLSLSIPQGGGLVAGRHTVSVNAGNEIDSYSVFLNGGTNENGVDNTDLVNPMADSLPSTGSLATSIPSLSWDTVDNFTRPTNFPIYGNSWGVALPDSYTGEYHDKERYETLIATPATIVGGAANYLFSGIPPLSYGQSDSDPYRLDGNEIISQTDSSSSSADIYYGVKVDNPSIMLAGDYTANVVYTVVAELKVPSINSVSPNPIDTGTSNKITLTGSNLDIVSKVTIDDRNTYRECTSLTHSGSTKLTCTLPAISNAGNYIITAETAGEQTAATTIQVKLPTPAITSVSPNEINTNNSTTTLTITGTNLATTSSVYIDFNNNNKADSGETCTIRTKANGQVTCTAPSRSSAGGPYTVRLTTDGGSASKASAVSYVTPVPVITRVSPSKVKSLSSFRQDVNFTVTGNNLDSVRKITLYLDGDTSGGTNQQDCSIRNSSSSSLTCTVYSWSLVPMWGNEPIRAEMYDAGGVLLGVNNAFCMANLM